VKCWFTNLFFSIRVVSDVHKFSDLWRINLFIFTAKKYSKFYAAVFSNKIILFVKYVICGWLAAWLSGNGLVLSNVVALRQAQLVLGWVTVRGYTILVFNQSHPGLLSLAIPLWVGTMSTGGGLGYR